VWPGDALSADWKVSVVVLRSGGRDESGRPRPVTETALDDVLIAPTSSSEPDALASATTSFSTLYAPPGTDIRSTDRIRLPDGGVWDVVGDASSWPLGVVVQLTRKRGGA
jgi:hypothetical protein